MKSFKFINNIAGWICFAIAAIVYLLTIEPTSSFWDCGEFIATSYKMEVGHAPGNSMFMLIARFFSLFTTSPTQVALLINAMSALCSAFCILFLFWSITHLARRIYTLQNNEPTLTSSQTITVIGAGFIGALAYTFSDTFWFSAVEGEVYAMSSLFTALVFWAILKWEEEADLKFANRWLILLAYLMGVSIGVHLLNLLALPAIVFVYYYKKYPVTRKGILITLLLCAIILVLAVFVIIPGLPQLAKVFELIFVNNFGLTFNSGLAFYAFFVIALLSLGVYYTYKPNKIVSASIVVLLMILACVLIYALLNSILPVLYTLLFMLVCGLIVRYRDKYRVLLNTVFLCLALFILGYFSLATIVIRSAANPPVNENWPDNVFSLISYINREQYGDRPLFTGPSFASPVNYKPNGEPDATYTDFYFKDKTEDDKEFYNSKEVFAGYNFNSDYNMLFPRLYSRMPESHIYEYAEWTKMRIPRDQNGRIDPNWRGPTQYENLKFMFGYQFNWMYWRYFLWNYVGRQNDIQGHGNSYEGNWITGINFIDDARLNIKTSDLPDYLKENKGYNRYFLLPFILGLIGLLYQLFNDKRNCWVVFLLFIMTGLAIAFYLNMPPLQPRERDYVFAGSTYAFAIWIGLGVLALKDAFGGFIKSSTLAPVASITLSMAVPVIMAVQNWDDHDRSNRYTARDIAYNYLATCDKNAILITFGDNDTFPLWYMQEVEEERTDIRVINTSLLLGDWYIDQMKYKVYDSEPVPFTLSPEHYRSGTNDRVYIQEMTKEAYTAKQIIEFIVNPRTKFYDDDNYIPTRTIAVPVDKQAALANGIVSVKDSANIVDTVYLTMPESKRDFSRAEMMIIDLLADYKWDRPIYFTSATGDIQIGQEDFLQFEGFAYKFVPVKTTDKGVTGLDYGKIDTDVLYANLMEKYRWGNMNVPGVLMDYHNMVIIIMVQNVRGQYARLARALISEDKIDRANEVLDYCMKLTPRNPFFYNISQPLHEFAVMDIISCYYHINEPEKANRIFDDFVEETNKCLKFFNIKNGAIDKVEWNMRYLYQLGIIAAEFGENERAEKVNNLLTGYFHLYNIQ